MNEKIISVILIFCIFLSSFVLNFSYGLYQNYNIKKYEENAKLNSLNIDIKNENPIKKADFQKYIESLSEKTLSSFSSIFIAGKVNKLGEECYNTLDSRFLYKNGIYSSPQILLDNFEI